MAGRTLLSRKENENLLFMSSKPQQGMYVCWLVSSHLKVGSVGNSREVQVKNWKLSGAGG